MAAEFLHRAFGLHIAANRCIAGLPPARGDVDCDLRVKLRRRGRWWDAHRSAAARAWRVHPLADENGRPVLVARRSEDGGCFHLAWPDGTEFVVDRDARRIWGTWDAPYTLDDAATYLVGPVLGFALRLRGRVPLHASAVELDGAAALFLGPSGAGKSTLAAAFAGRGARVLCDDAAALVRRDGRAWVQPGSARVGLWPDSARALYGRGGGGLPRLTPNWEKRYLDLSDLPGARCDDPLPLAGLYALEPPAPRSRVPRLRPAAPREALQLLLSHTYVGFLQDAHMRAREFELLSDLALRVPLKRLRPTWGAATGSTCALLAADARAAAAP